MSGLVLAALSALAPDAAPGRAPAWVVNVGLTAEQVQARTDALSASGYRPTGISAYNAVEANRFAVVYEQGAGPAWQMLWGLAPVEFQRRDADLRSRGYVPECLSGGNWLGAERLSALWVRRPGTDRELSYGLDRDGILREADRQRGRGYRPVWASSYMVNSANAYAVIWEKGGPAWEVRVGLSPDDLQSSIDDLSARGFRPVSISGLNAGGVVRYTAVWEKRAGAAWEARFGQDQGALLDTARAMSARGFRPRAVMGFNTLRGDRFASVWEQAR
jgi:hypothetical protein